MPIAVRCPTCSKKLSAPDALAGKRAKCPHCSQLMQIPVPPPRPPQPQEVFEDLSRSDPLAAMGPSNPAGATAGVAAGAASTFGLGGLSTQQFDEMLADVGPKIDVKPTEPKQDRYPCPVCHELIVRGSAKCRYCGEDFNKYAPPKRRGSSTAARNFNTNMNTLGAIWTSLGALFTGILLFAAMAASASDKPDAKNAAPILFIIAMIPGCMLVLGIATLRKAIWAVWIGLIWYYLNLAVGIIVILLVFLFGQFRFTLLVSSLPGLVITVLLIKLCHRCIYWKKQMR